MYILGINGSVSGASLEDVLNRITRSPVVDVERNEFRMIAEASHNADDRQTIMGHLYRCLSHSISTRWREVYSGLVAVQQLLQWGSPLVVLEVAQGLHFDIVQRLVVLCDFQYTEDDRVQTAVRRKARELRIAWERRQLELSEEGARANGMNRQGEYGAGSLEIGRLTIASSHDDEHGVTWDSNGVGTLCKVNVTTPSHGDASPRCVSVSPRRKAAPCGLGTFLDHNDGDSTDEDTLVEEPRKVNVTTPSHVGTTPGCGSVPPKRKAPSGGLGNLLDDNDRYSDYDDTVVEESQALPPWLASTMEEEDKSLQAAIAASCEGYAAVIASGGSTAASTASPPRLGVEAKVGRQRVEGACVRVFFRAEAGSSDIPVVFTRRPLGFFWDHGERRVTRISPGSHADQLGVKAGWQIVGLNSLMVAGMQVNEFRKLFVNVVSVLPQEA